MKEITFLRSVSVYKKGQKYNILDRYADSLIKKGFATDKEKEEEPKPKKTRSKKTKGEGE